MSSLALADIDTPALIVDLPKLKGNIERVRQSATNAGLALRPHIKAHKTPEIAQMQIDAGAVGVTAAKVSEAEAMVDGGIVDVFIANEIVGEFKLRRLGAMRERAKVSVACDSVEVARGYAEHVGSVDDPLEVVLELDLGAKRCGVMPEDAGALADAIAQMPGLRLVGLMGYAPMTYNVDSAGERVPLVSAEGELLSGVADALRERGHDIERISGGCTPGALLYPADSGLTEIRPGTYVFYDRNQVDLGVIGIEAVAATILTTVVSKRGPDRAIVDAGSKALANQVKRVSPGFGWVKGNPAAHLDNVNDEHGYLNLEDSELDVAIGDKVEIIPPRICTALNLYDDPHIVEDGRVVQTCAIAARGKNR